MSIYEVRQNVQLEKKKVLCEKILFKILLFSLIHQLWKNIFQNFAVFANPTILLEIDIR